MYFVIEAKFVAGNPDYPKGVSSHTQRLGSVTAHNGRLGTHSHTAHLFDIRLKAMASVLRAVSLLVWLKNSCIFSALMLLIQKL